jgi:hypothetical protein
MFISVTRMYHKRTAVTPKKKRLKPNFEQLGTAGLVGFLPVGLRSSKADTGHSLYGGVGP